ncbi:MAG TPA: serine hydrolase domain-containing protein [Candidatus Acidoferrales bacterium]|nr:serine hydrolase domain-containing protein [Candidatus Acidoferrales bacterium]
MKNIRFASRALALMAGLLFASGAFQAQAPPAARKSSDLAVTKPESVGFSSPRLERLHQLMQQTVDAKQIAGAVTILARHGKIVDFKAYGQNDMASGSPMTKDVIFRDFSMTKPVTGVAMMILYEQGKWLPSDPISKFIPEFAHLKVFKGVDADGKMILEDPIHPPTMRELLSHTAGFTYGIFGNTPVDKMYRDTQVLASKNLQEMIERLAKIPLAYQPGRAWVYSVSVDIQGYIVEKLSGQSLPDFMEEHIFKPLAMKDTGFFVPKEKRGRFAALYRANLKGELMADPTAGGLAGDYSTQPTMPSGGGGLTSTTMDYFRFAQMLENKGELDGVRILSPSSVQLMSSNHVPTDLLNGQFGIGLQTLRPGFGYGYDCAVIFDPLEANLSDGKGTFFWDGLAGTWFWIDPSNDVVFIGMIQRILGPSSPNLEYESRSVVYQALMNPKL